MLKYKKPIVAIGLFLFLLSSILGGIFLYSQFGLDTQEQQNDSLAIIPQFAYKFNNPVDMQQPPENGDFFVVEQSGKIYQLKNFNDTPTLFLDISSQVASGGERGLLGLAFHPNYATTGQFFVDYTTNNPFRTVISRFETNNMGIATPSSELIILEVEQPAQNHNAGQLLFGPDGFLYITLGDGGFSGDPWDNAQDRTTLLGSILRLDVTASTKEIPYSIPNDNPFYMTEQGFKQEIWAYGLRNPWRISFDHQTLWAADVGQNSWEEINIIEKGGNYGWNRKEGTQCYQAVSCGDYIDPIFEYGRELGSSVTGGHVYRGKDTSLFGKYIFADYVSGRVWALQKNETSVSASEILNLDIQISSFGLDHAGEIYICSHLDGIIYKITNAGTM